MNPDLERMLTFPWPEELILVHPSGRTGVLRRTGPEAPFYYTDYEDDFEFIFYPDILPGDRPETMERCNRNYLGTLIAEGWRVRTCYDPDS